MGLWYNLLAFGGLRTFSDSVWIHTDIHIYIYIYLYNYIYIYIIIYLYTVTTFIYFCSNIRTGILDYLREGFPWPTRPLKHTESKLFTHTFKYTDGTVVSYYLAGIAVLNPNPHMPDRNLDPVVFGPGQLIIQFPLPSGND